jgi:hypothetical protein
MRKTGVKVTLTPVLQHVPHPHFQDGVLTLEGTSHTKSRDLPHRITWKAEKGGVRETGMISTGGKTGVPAFDVLFLKHHDT